VIDPVTVCADKDADKASEHAMVASKHPQRETKEFVFHETLASTVFRIAPGLVERAPENLARRI
jgi:hypothetical protein